jgi:hypothetical protein
MKLVINGGISRLVGLSLGLQPEPSVGCTNNTMDEIKEAAEMTMR